MGEMLLVTPVCNKDMGQLTSLLNWMKELDSCSDITAFLVAEKGTDWRAIDKFYRKYFQYYYTWELQDDSGSNTWPIPQNHIFKRVVQYLGGQFTSLPKISDSFTSFFFMEPDVLPFDKNWFHRLKELYEEGNKPFMGSIVDTLKNGAVVGRHMNGAAVYPRNAIDYSASFVLSGGNPWDINSSKDIEGKVNDISDCYRITFGSFAFSGSFTRWACYQKFADGEVKMVEGAFARQFLHHGCKDGSLLDLIRASKLKPEKMKDLAIPRKRHRPARRRRKKEFFPEYHEKRYGKAKERKHRDTTF